MSNARELALLEKWAEVATSGAIPPLSPTSPKATKFCCCPNRRRYNVKQPKKSTLHARNIFIDNDFTYIDDGTQETSRSPGNSQSPSTGPATATAVGSEVGSSVDNSQLNADTKSIYSNDYDDIIEVGNNTGNGLMNTVEANEQQWRHDKSCHNNNPNNTSNTNNINNSANNTSCKCFKDPATSAPTTHPTNAQNQQQEKLLEIENNCAVTNENATPSENDTAAAVKQRQQEININVVSRKIQRQQPIQRLSNTKFNPNNKPRIICNTSNDASAGCCCPDSPPSTQNRRCNYCLQREQGSPKIQTDSPPKMTITTTNVASRKRSECGLPSPTTPETAEAPTTTTARPTTPSLTTVIKTTLVKRCPSSEATSPANNAASPTCPIMFTFSSNASGPMCDPSLEPARSVRERIAAYAAGNEPNRSNDSSIKYKTQCNKTSSPFMTSQAKTAINSHNQPDASSLNGTAPPGAASQPSLSSAADTKSSSAPTADIPCRQSGLNDEQSAAPSTAGATLSGSATMPRRRSPALSVNERYCNGHKYGSKPAAMTADKKFLSSSAHKPLNGDKHGKETVCHDLDALNNLDLALNLDLTDEDGGDPYYVLQAYLDKVKHEINEVFEYKARQRMQLQQQQHQQQQHQQPPEQQDPAAATAVASNDELSRSTESDSGFDSASGGQQNGSSKKLPTRAYATPMAKGQAADEEVNTPVMKISCESDINGHAATTAMAGKQLLDTANMQQSTETSAPTPTTTQLKALTPPPVGPSPNVNSADDNNLAAASTSTLKRLRQQQLPPTPAAADTEASSEDVNIWANKFLRDLDNLMASDKPTSSSTSSSPTSTTSPMLLSAAASAAIHCRYGKSAPERDQSTASNGVVLRPEKHATIPLQSFNLDCGRLDGNNAAKTQIAYMRTLSAPTPYQQHMPQQQAHDNKSTCLANGRPNRNSLAAFNATVEPHNHPAHNRTNFQSNDAAAKTILKIEETNRQRQLADEEKLKSRRQRQMDTDMETIQRALICQSQQLASMEAGNHSSALVASSGPATAAPKRERINHVISPSSTMLTPSKAGSAGSGGVSSSSSSSATSYLLNGSDPTKKGSTSTIWTSEESILRSVGAVDEDNNSTSSSACEEASGVLSSGKSGISLDSSGLDNDNNESGIGTATPPKDMSYWKSVHNDNESVSSLDALRKMKFQKSSSVASSDDPDLLEVLSLCDEPHGDEEDVGADVNESHDDIVDQRQTAQQQKRQARHRQCRQRDNNNSAHSASKPSEADDDDEVDEHDEEDEGQDEFETIPYCDCDCTDGDASSTSGSRSVGGNTSVGSSANDVLSGVVLRRKYNANPIMVPYGGRNLKCRSHSLETASLPTAYHLYHVQHQHMPHSHTQLARKLHHLNGRTKERGQLSLALRQEPFQSMLAPTHFHELPSPSSASLHSGHESLGIQELTTKSNSAPLLLKQEKKRDDFAGQKLTLRYSRSQSDRYLAEIEAVEACKWLRAAGFPQYAQMYEDHQFPIDLTNVAKDHTNLENDQLQSLYRRLCILNRCASMRLDQSHKVQTPQKEDSDDENFALSENWTFQPHIRRWSRIGEMGLELPPGGKINADKTESSSKESSPDRFEDDSYDASGAGLSLTLPGTGDSNDSNLNESTDAAGVRLRRTGSERIKDGAKAFLRRVESIKSRRRKRQNREGIVISGPQALDLSQLGQRSSMRKPDAVYSTPPSPSAVSPMHTFPKSPFFGNELKVPSQSDTYLTPNRASPKRTPTTPRSMRTSPLHFFSNTMSQLKEGKSDDSSSYYSDSQESSAGGKLTIRKVPSKTRRFLQRTGKVDDIGAHSDSECHQGRKLLIKDANSNTTEVKLKKLTRGGSLNLGKDPKKREGLRSASFRSRSTTRKEGKADEAENIKRSPVVRWHSFQMEERPHMIFRKCFSQKIDPNSNDHGIPFAAMSAGQLQIIRKLALVVLTGHMERYCPTHRSGWNWELPKFIKKIKMPDYKDKRVFGIPLLLVLQRSGQTLPIAVRAAFRWLQLNALDQIGIFRKSGVKSRIIKLKELIEYSETTAECMEVFDAQQAYDVADMLKQYFRDLPESLLTTKMSETFAAIFQHLPPDVRLDAVQCAVLLLPDENREILFALLEFLTLVAGNSQFNQMTANNLAVCLAPSLFHSSISTGSSSVAASPRRRKGAGVPDAKELSEAKASHECLAFMIEHYKEIFTASKDKLSKCNFGYMEESKPVPLEALGEGMQFHNWRGYLYECTSATIKEGREKTRGWITITSQTDNGVEIAYKKVGDGHPLRLWRCITEVEGPPKDVLDYITKQRASWDPNLLQCQTVKKLDDRTEIFQYALDGQITTDFCVLRSWQMDLPRGACVIVETSIDHSKAKPMFGAVRGVVLASRYLIEPCGSGRSRVMHLARVDIKGKTPEWYNKSYGHICSHYLSKIRMAFKNVADGPESKV